MVMALSAMTMQCPSVFRLPDKQPFSSLPQNSFSLRFSPLKLNRWKPLLIRSTSIPGAPFPWFLCIKLQNFVSLCICVFMYVRYTFLTYIFCLLFGYLLGQCDWNVTYDCVEIYHLEFYFMCLKVILDFQPVCVE